MRDGGYYNSWDFPIDIVDNYLNAMSAGGVNIVEIGLRSLKNSGFKGAYAFCSEEFLDSLSIPKNIELGVMINAAEIVGVVEQNEVLEKLFPIASENSKVDLVRIACHVHEFAQALPACNWLKSKGFKVGFNLMQVADRSKAEVEALAKLAADYPIDALYFADSMGSMDPSSTSEIIRWFRSYWKGEMGIHTHDNMGLALSNTLQAIKDGVTWLDSTVTGMGRGPGNARTEELIIEVSEIKNTEANLVPIMSLIKEYFQPLKNECGWGSNPYYFLSGKYGIHPTYIQEMLGDSRYNEEDILAAINHLKVEGGKKFSFNTLDATRHFYTSSGTGSWSPTTVFEGRNVLILGAGKSAKVHKSAIESYIKMSKPVVLALNTQTPVSQELIDYRIACHPVRLLADCDAHGELPQPLIVPASSLPSEIKNALGNKTLFDFGLTIDESGFKLKDTSAAIPNSLVISYALAAITTGKASKIFLAGFDGFGANDPRSAEMQHIFDLYFETENATEIVSITPTSYSIETKSVYALQG